MAGGISVNAGTSRINSRQPPPREHRQGEPGATEQSSAATNPHFTHSLTPSERPPARLIGDPYLPLSLSLSLWLYLPGGSLSLVCCRQDVTTKLAELNAQLLATQQSELMAEAASKGKKEVRIFMEGTSRRVPRAVGRRAVVTACPREREMRPSPACLSLSLSLALGAFDLDLIIAHMSIYGNNH